MSDRVQEVGERVGWILEHKIAPLFKAGAKLTLVARLIPGETEAELVVGDDDLDEVRAAIERAQVRDKRMV